MSREASESPPTPIDLPPPGLSPHAFNPPRETTLREFIGLVAWDVPSRRPAVIADDPLEGDHDVPDPV